MCRPPHPTQPPHAPPPNARNIPPTRTPPCWRRVFAGSAYLSVETLVGGSLWFAIGTSSAGVLAAALLARRQGAGGGSGPNGPGPGSR